MHRTCSWSVRSAACRPASATNCSATAARSVSAASAREWSTNDPAEREISERRRAGAPEGVRLQEHHGRAEDREGRREHGPRRGDVARQDSGYRRREVVAYYRTEACDSACEEINRAVQGPQRPAD